MSVTPNKQLEAKTVRDLIELLEPHRGKLCKATWEGITARIYVYEAKDGTVMIDADGAHYRASFQGLKCHCGEDARAVDGVQPVCYKHRIYDEDDE